MTTAGERAQSLGRARDVLTALREDPNTPAACRAEITLLLTSYPSQVELEDWIGTGAALPLEAAGAIEQAGELMRTLWSQDDLPGHHRLPLQYALRHFPGPGAARSWARSRRPVGAWMASSGAGDPPAASADSGHDP